MMQAQIKKNDNHIPIEGLVRGSPLILYNSRFTPRFVSSQLSPCPWMMQVLAKNWKDLVFFNAQHENRAKFLSLADTPWHVFKRRGRSSR